MLSELFKSVPSIDTIVVSTDNLQLSIPKDHCKYSESKLSTYIERDDKSTFIQFYNSQVKSCWIIDNCTLFIILQ